MRRASPSITSVTGEEEETRDRLRRAASHLPRSSPASPGVLSDWTGGGLRCTDWLTAGFSPPYLAPSRMPPLPAGRGSGTGGPHCNLRLLESTRSSPPRLKSPSEGAGSRGPGKRRCPVGVWSAAFSASQLLPQGCGEGNAVGFKGLTPSSWQLLGTGARLWQPSMPDPRRPSVAARPTRVWGPQAQGTSCWLSRQTRVRSAARLEGGTHASQGSGAGAPLEWAEDQSQEPQTGKCSSGAE